MLNNSPAEEAEELVSQISHTVECSQMWSHECDSFFSDVLKKIKRRKKPRDFEFCEDYITIF